MNTIEEGDKVQHKTNNNYNHILMGVVESRGDTRLCSYHSLTTQKTDFEWFRVDDLRLYKKAEGRF